MDDRIRFAALLAVAGCALAAPAPGHAQSASADDLLRTCTRGKNDDTIRSYSPVLQQKTQSAYRMAFPDAKGAPGDGELQTQAQYRCMRGRIVVCFIGANLPCTKLNTARDNPGASEFCRGNPASATVPAAATGHDTIYSYRCRKGRAETSGRIWDLDERGFARKLWYALPR